MSAILTPIYMSETKKGNKGNTKSEGKTFILYWRVHFKRQNFKMVVYRVKTHNKIYLA